MNKEPARCFCEWALCRAFFEGEPVDRIETHNEIAAVPLPSRKATPAPGWYRPHRTW